MYTKNERNKINKPERPCIGMCKLRGRGQRMGRAARRKADRSMQASLSLIKFSTGHGCIPDATSFHSECNLEDDALPTLHMDAETAVLVRSGLRFQFSCAFVTSNL